MMTHILVVEDEQAIADNIMLYLKHDGYSVSHLKNGNDVLNFIMQKQPALLILDLMIPGIDGIEVCTQVRQRSKLPIIILTARSTEDDRILGLETGADDYVCKPFSPRELMSRVKACLRRMDSEKPMKPEILEFPDIQINLITREIIISGKSITLTTTEFDLLTLLASNPNKAFSRQELLDRVLSESLESTDRTIDTHVNNLRKKIEPDRSNPIMIMTVFGFGYKFKGHNSVS